MRGTPRATAKLIKEAPESLFQFFLDRCSQLQATGTIGLPDFCNAQRLMRLIEASVIMAAAADVGSGSPSISVPMEAEVSMQSLKNKMVHTISVMSNQNGESNN
uniref:Uncharacterized protein n=1 Tax=Oryza punctata TaxID=4537 RepID=A0A0E0JU16_ORYPU